ncbi:MAG: hypothetical protein FGM35_08760 [Rhodocyclaceae bacterium]|jgi:hypothetical protein|nr:hypothetical protein [Rhodocyclaceae bacterium]
MLNPHTFLAEHTFELMPFLQNLTVGAFGLFTNIWINVFFLRRISVYYEINARIHLGKDRYNRVFLTYFTAIVFLMLSQVVSILAWSGLILLLGLSSSPFNALLFVGSCYTTIGIVSDTMPNVWKLQALFIALSGLFAMALSTATMLSMSRLFRMAWYRKHDKVIRAIMTKNHVTIPELDELEGKLPPSNIGR